MRATQWTINITDNERIADISAVTYGIKMLVRNLSANYYIPVNQANESELVQCHLKTIRDYINIKVNGSNINVNINSKPIIILALKAYDDNIANCNTLHDVENLFNCKLVYIGEYRQAKGLRKSIINSIKKSLKNLL